MNYESYRFRDALFTGLRYCKEDRMGTSKERDVVPGISRLSTGFWTLPSVSI